MYGEPPASAARASPAPAVQSTEAEEPGREPFDPGGVGIELGLGLLGEAWNLNGSREWLAGGRAGVWWTFLPRTTLVVEVHGTRIFQQAPHNAFVTALVPLVRIRAVARPAWQLFAEIGVGPSWSDTDVPPRGTRFNYYGLAGLGVARRTSRQTRVIAGFRWLHLSNAGREGRDRNPDIQALGGHVALAVGF